MQLFERYEGEGTTIFHGSCTDVLTEIPDGSVDLVFADPPYNIGKKFGDFKDAWPSNGAYADWCYAWLDHHVRVRR